MTNSVKGCIQDHSDGLPHIGVQKFPESLRAYVFLTLSSQSSAPISIIGQDQGVLKETDQTTVQDGKKCGG